MNKEDNKGQKGFIDKYLGSDDDDSKEDSPPGSSRVPPAPPSPPTGGYNPFEPPLPFEDSDPLIKSPKEYYFPYSSRIKPVYFNIEDSEQINLDGNLREIFPDADEALATNAEPKENTYFGDFSDQLDRGEILEELEFFSGGKSNSNFLFRQIESHNLIEGNQKFTEYLATYEFQDALERDGISIHVTSGDIFINNQNTGESLYMFLNNKRDETKK